MTAAKFDADAIEAEWRSVPADLAAWSMRATAMLILAKRYHAALQEIATRDFGVYEPSADEGEMRDEARRAIEPR